MSHNEIVVEKVPRRVVRNYRGPRAVGKLHVKIELLSIKQYIWTICMSNNSRWCASNKTYMTRGHALRGWLKFQKEFRADTEMLEVRYGGD